MNPYKYRGYVYDYETGLYYLNSRYYDPVTGRFLNADIYCDTQSSIMGTNMFAYCNNNPVNQIDPEGTDAMWLQFEDGVPVAWWTEGHTSLLLQDASNNWWYFYWGPKHVILRPCGKDDFTLPELNSFLIGFDPRRRHNYYVYATNVIDDSEDINYSAGSGYYLKCHDKAVTCTIRFHGDFKYAYNYAKDLLERLYINSNATQLVKKVYENGKAIYIYDVCTRVDSKVAIPTGYYYADILPTNKDKIKGYDTFHNNCVQVSMKVLLQGNFNSCCEEYWKEIKYNISEYHPNKMHRKLIKIICNRGGGSGSF